MNLASVRVLANTILDDFKKERTSDELKDYPHLETEFKNLMSICCKVLPDHITLFNSALTQLGRTYLDDMNYFPIDDAISITQHILKIIKIENASDEKIKALKIFDSAEEKMKQAGLCFQDGDYPSVFHSLNTALELVLKDKLNIPSTITNINTSNIVDVLVKYKVEPHLYLTEAKKHVLTIDNKIKHQGYAPLKVDSINGIKAMEELISKLRNTNFELSEEIRNKIFEGL